MVGRVFSIEEFSTFNGPGIRMTVFLKGCPLRCEWCHSPEGQRFETEILRNPNGCLNCGRCLEAGERDTGKPCLTAASVPVCPRHLIRVCGKDMTPEALTEVIRQKAPLLNASGGGVTFSGGEPLMQPGFLINCLLLLKPITNRALQTSGYCSGEIFKKVLVDCDYVLYDLKLIDEEAHQRYTGVSNRTILENFAWLVKSGVPFSVRIPLIPTATDTAENITRTAKFLRSLNVKKAELLPYNRFAGGKYRLAGREYLPTFDETLDPNPQKKIFAEYGVEVSVL